MDLEDGFNFGYYNYEFVSKYFRKNGDEYVKSLIENFEKKSLKEVDEIQVNRERTKIVKLRIYLIKLLVEEATKIFLNNLDDIEKGNYKEELLPDTNPIIKILKDFTINNIFKRRQVQSMELTGESILKGLLDHFVPAFINCKCKDDYKKKKPEKLFGLISGSLKELLILVTNNLDVKLYELNDYQKLRLIIDYISGMTDNFALSLYQKLQGIKI